MCQVSMQTKEEQTEPVCRERDVDDLIFRDEPGWQTSDR